LRCRSSSGTSRCVSGTCELCLQQPELVRRTGCSNDLVLLHSWPRPLTLWLVMVRPRRLAAGSGPRVGSVEDVLGSSPPAR
jgi:hypothetical protein